MQFLHAKLLDYQDRCEELLQSDNPFAPFVIAHLKTMQTRRCPQDRYEWKLAITQQLYEDHDPVDREQVGDLIRCIDWIMGLPKSLESTCWDDVRKLEEQHNMTYMTLPERQSFQKVWSRD